MSLCPKCNKEYSDELPTCPFCEGEDLTSKVTDTTKNVGKTDNVDAEEITTQIAKETEDVPFSITPEPDKKNKNFLIAIIAAVVVAIAAIVIIIFCLFGNKGNDKATSNNNSSSATEEMTMPSGYEDIIKDIKDSEGHVITQATDPYGNEVTREVDENGNITTTYVGPNGEISSVTTDSEGNIISYDIPESNNNSSNTGSNSSSKNESSKSESTNSQSSSSQSSNNTSSTTNNPSSTGITINGKSYNVGDTVTFIGTAEGISDPVAGYSFTINFDENLLELDKDSIELLDGSIVNTEYQEGVILLNGISISTGYNFSVPCQFIKCTFKVKDSSVKSCDITITADEVYTGIGAIDLVDVTNKVEPSVTVE